MPTLPARLSKVTPTGSRARVPRIDAGAAGAPALALSKAANKLSEQIFEFGKEQKQQEEIEQTLRLTTDGVSKLNSATIESMQDPDFNGHAKRVEDAYRRILQDTLSQTDDRRVDLLVRKSLTPIMQKGIFTAHKFQLKKSHDATLDAANRRAAQISGELSVIPFGQERDSKIIDLKALTDSLAAGSTTSRTNATALFDKTIEDSEIARAIRVRSQNPDKFVADVRDGKFNLIQDKSQLERLVQGAAVVKRAIIAAAERAERIDRKEREESTEKKANELLIDGILTFDDIEQLSDQGMKSSDVRYYQRKLTEAQDPKTDPAKWAQLDLAVDRGDPDMEDRINQAVEDKLVNHADRKELILRYRRLRDKRRGDVLKESVIADKKKFFIDLGQAKTKSQKDDLLGRVEQSDISLISKSFFRTAISKGLPAVKSDPAVFADIDRRIRAVEEGADDKVYDAMKEGTLSLSDGSSMITKFDTSVRRRVRGEDKEDNLFVRDAKARLAAAFQFNKVTEQFKDPAVAEKYFTALQMLRARVNDSKNPLVGEEIIEFVKKITGPLVKEFFDEKRNDRVVSPPPLDPAEHKGKVKVDTETETRWLSDGKRWLRTR